MRPPSLSGKRKHSERDTLRADSHVEVDGVVYASVSPRRGGEDGGEENLMLEGSCDCGAVRYTVDGTLDELTQCNCGICRRSGGLWAYYSPKKVTMTGPTDIYMRGDRMLELHYCKICHCLMWWVPVDKSYDRMGVNARMLPLGAWDETPIKTCDGASW